MEPTEQAILQAAATIYGNGMVTKPRGYTRTDRVPTISMEEAVERARDLLAAVRSEFQLGDRV